MVKLYAKNSKIRLNNLSSKKVGAMKIQTNAAVNRKSTRVWLKKLAWALPLFFLIKGLLWLTVPVLFTIYYSK